MKEFYTSPEIEILYVSEDIITTSPVGVHKVDNAYDLFPDIDMNQP